MQQNNHENNIDTEKTAVFDGPIAVSSSDGLIHRKDNSFGRRLAALRDTVADTKKGSCTHTGWDS